MKILVVCLGNICRSPAAQGIFEYLACSQSLDLTVDSAGTAAYHIGKRPDARSINALAQVGIDISKQSARQVGQQDFYEFDWILAMDKENLLNLQSIKPLDATAKVVMFGGFDSAAEFGEVDDPYYGGDAGFVVMRKHLFAIAESFLERHYE
ncbi:MAG: low molecular weight phosphotyrosine protein phosphatase [Marinomonas sp.]|nr:MAG: low molecular weight phosphotyrosine protein phosphatase [Marinomonas sp.]